MGKFKFLKALMNKNGSNDSPELTSVKSVIQTHKKNLPEELAKYVKKVLQATEINNVYSAMATILKVGFNTMNKSELQNFYNDILENCPLTVIKQITLACISACKGFQEDMANVNLYHEGVDTLNFCKDLNADTENDLKFLSFISVDNEAFPQWVKKEMRTLNEIMNLREQEQSKFKK